MVFFVHVLSPPWLDSLFRTRGDGRPLNSTRYLAETARENGGKIENRNKEKKRERHGKEKEKEQGVRKKKKNKEKIYIMETPGCGSKHGAARTILRVFSLTLSQKAKRQGLAI